MDTRKYAEYVVRGKVSFKGELSVKGVRGPEKYVTKPKFLLSSPPIFADIDSPHFCKSASGWSDCDANVESVWDASLGGCGDKKVHVWRMLYYRARTLNSHTTISAMQFHVRSVA